MNVSKITTKYQATIPEEVRLALGLQIGDKVLYKDINPVKKEAIIHVFPSKNVANELIGSLNPGGAIKYIPISKVRQRSGGLLATKYGLVK